MQAEAIESAVSSKNRTFQILREVNSWVISRWVRLVERKGWNLFGCGGLGKYEEQPQGDVSR